MKVGTEFLFLNPTSKWLSVKFTVIDIGEESCFLEYHKDGVRDKVEVGINDIIKVWTEGKIVFTKPDVKCLNTEEVFSSLYD